MKNLCVSITFVMLLQNALAQTSHPLFKGMYIQWGYNTEWYTRSNIDFRLNNGSHFTLHQVRATDKPDMDAILKKPFEISIPQYNYRIGFYLNDKKTKALEINFDHTKYVVTDGQTVHVTGKIEGQDVNGDSTLSPAHFLHLEHTDGANWLQINYVQQQAIRTNPITKKQQLTFLWKAGLGINIPRTDFTWKGNRLNNQFHVAGYNIGVESGIRYYFFRNLFLESTSKIGYVRYVNALANTYELSDSRVSHGFGYLEFIGLLGFDIRF